MLLITKENFDSEDKLVAKPDKKDKIDLFDLIVSYNA